MIVAAWPWGAYLGEEGKKHGIRAKVSSWRRISPAGLIPHAKASGQYLNSILAKTESANAGYDEAILLDERGFVCEGSGENIFVVREGEIVTPPHVASILDGINRKSVIQIARDLGYTVVERDIARAELYLAEEVFLTGTAAELVPVREIDDHALGEPGEITRVIQAKFEDALHGRAEEYLEWLDLVEVPAGSGPSRVRSAPDATPLSSRQSGELPQPPSGWRGDRGRRAAPAVPQAHPRFSSNRKASDGTGKALRHDLARRHAGPGHVALRRREGHASSRPSTRSASHFIEAGFPSSNPKEAELFELLAELELEQRDDLRLRHDPAARTSAAEDDGAARCWPTGFAPVVTPGRQDLGPAPREGDRRSRREENLAMIADSVAFCRGRASGWSTTPSTSSTATATTPATRSSACGPRPTPGAENVTLCDTNGSQPAGRRSPRRPRPWSASWATGRGRHPHPQRRRVRGRQLAGRGRGGRAPRAGHDQRLRRALRQRQPRPRSCRRCS